MKPTGPPAPGSDTADRRYRFTSTWRLDAPVERVWQVLDDLVDGPDPFAWWPDLRTTGREGDDLHVEARSGVGYRLRFRLHDLRVDRPRSLDFRADGDLVGEGHVEPSAGAAGGTVLEILWTVDATRPWMRRTAPVLRPVFVLAHAVVMRRGRRSLQRRLATR